MVLVLKKRIYKIALPILFLDQLIKYIIVTNFSYGKTFFLLPNIIYLTYVKNTGGAFSIFSENLSVLLIISIVSIGLLGYYIEKKKSFSSLETIYFGFMIGGVLGNLIDRLFKNGVVDYIGLLFGNYYFPIFNLADIAIVGGVIVFIIDTLRSDISGVRSNKR